VVGGGWVREVENKAKLSPAGAGAWAELGKMYPSFMPAAKGSARTPLGPKK
jgi:hypothetical protein